MSLVDGKRAPPPLEWRGGATMPMGIYVEGVFMNHRIEVTGHRGAAAVEPENTRRGIRHALALGVDRVEIDVHLSKDDILVVMHDAAVDRTTDGTGKIAEM